MNKKLLLSIAALPLLLCLFAGCGENKTINTTTLDATIGATGEPFTTVEATEETIPTIPDGPQETAPDLIEYDPDREIYFTGHNQSYTIYYSESTSPVFSFNIYSLKPLDLDTLEVDIPLNVEYFILSKEVKLNTQCLTQERLLGYKQGETVYPYYVYLCQKGMDFRALRRLWRQYQLLDTGENETSEQIQAVMDAQNAYYDYLYQYFDEFAAIPQEELPEFYCYAVTVVFGRDGLTIEEIMQMPSGTFTEFDVTISGETYHETVGEGGISFVPSFEPIGEEIYGKERTCYYDITSSLGSSNGWKPYGGGVFNESLHYFVCPENMVLTGIRLVDENHQFVKIYLEVNDVDVNWDGTETIYLNEGDKVSLEADIFDPRSDSLDYATYIWTILEIETAGGKFYELGQVYTGVGGRPLNIYELYYTVFEGLNTSTYWREYLYPLFLPQICN